MKAHVRSPTARPVWRNPEDILRSAHFLATRHARMVDAEMVAQMAKVLFSYVLNNQPVITLQETSSQSMFARHHNKLPIPEEDGNLLDDNNWLYVTKLEVQSLIDSSMFRAEEIALPRLTDRVIQSTMENLFETAARKATKEILSHIYKAVEDVFNEAVKLEALDIATSLGLDRLTEFQKSAQSIIGYSKKTAAFTAPIAKLVARRAEMTIMKKVSPYESSTIVVKENKEPRIPSPLTERYQASTGTFTHNEKQNYEKKRTLSLFWVIIKDVWFEQVHPQWLLSIALQKGNNYINRLRAVNTHFTE